MTRAYANVEGETVVEGVLHVPNVGPWWADLVFEGAPDLSGAVVFNLGPLALRGTIDPTRDGTFAEQRRTRVVAGGGGWGTLVAPQHYHSDSGVRALAIAQDAARLAGETLGDFAPEADAIGIDYVRERGPASRVLEDVIGAVAWWVDYDGVTRVGSRAISEADSADYQILDFNPADKLATVAIDDLSKVGIGSILSETLDAPLTVFELEVRVGVDSSRTTVWGGGTATGRGRLAESLRRIVQRVGLDRLYGRYRYRVVEMSGERVNLQAVARIAGLPNVLPVSMKPGIAGAHAKPAGGSIVHVIFVEGDRTMPRVVAFAGKDEEGHAPEELDLSVSSMLRLGDDGATSFVALADLVKSNHDTLQAAHDAHIHLTTATIGLGPAVGIISPTAAPVGSLPGVAATKVKAK